MLATFVFETGLLVLISSLDVPGATSRDIHMLRIGSLIGMTVGAVIWHIWRWLPSWSMHVGLVLQSAALLRLVQSTDETTIAWAYITLFVFALAYVGFFFSWVGMIGHLGWILVAAGWALHDLGMPVTGMALILNEFVLVTVAVGVLAHRGDKAQLDALTELPNRRALDRRAAAAIRQATTGEPLAVLIIDIDHFKSLNDTDGHAAGDALLVACARTWTRLAPSSAMVARLGGDEFCTLLPGWTLSEASELAERFRRVVPPPASASVGVAGWEDGDTVMMLLARADAALYDAKRAGRARVAVRGA